MRAITLMVLTAVALALMGTGCSRTSIDEPPELTRARQNMVRDLEQRVPQAEKRVLKAMGEIPRQEFLPPAESSRAYTGTPLPTTLGEYDCSPGLVAAVLSEMNPMDTHDVLMIEIPSGYPAAIASRLARKVVVLVMSEAKRAMITQQLDALGIKNAQVHVCDVMQGWSSEGPYESVLVIAQRSSVPDKIVEQMDDGGVVVQLQSPTARALNVMRMVERDLSQPQIVSLPAG